MFTIGRLDIGIRTRGAGTPPVPAAPASTSAPAITGSPIVGASLSCSTGGWTGFPAPTFTYQWIWADTSANISGATSSTYTPISGDLGHTLKCAVTATNSQGNATANSNTTAAVAQTPVNTVAPAVTGTATAGQTLSTTNGTWSNTPTSYAYQWKWADTGANISGATASTYVLVSGDVGHTIKCTVTATNAAGSASADSNTTGSIASGVPVNSVAPAVTGTTTVGSTLTTTSGTWTNSPSFTYQWKWADTGANISGATSTTYVLVSGDVGHTIKCTVTATNSQGTASTDSNTTAVVTADVTPAFQADFTALSALPTGVSFSRASNAMVSDSTGKLTYAPNNILLQSNNFSTTWSTVTATVSSGVSDPDGGTNASTLTATANGALLYQQVTIDGNYVNSIQIRRRTGSGAVSLRTPDNSVVAIGLSVTGSWQRFFVNGPAAGGPVYTFALVIATSGDAVDIYQAQGERVTYETTPRAYNPTTTAPYYGPRFDFAWNGSAWVATGLLIEEQRTNICTHSNDFTSGAWGKGSGTITTGIAAPDGTLTASTYTAVVNNDALAQAITVTNATVYTETFWVRRRTGTGFVGALDPSNGSYNDITSQVTSSWGKITLTGTSSGTLAFSHLILGVAGDAVDIAWFDLEQGAFATSYIPATTAAATRSADIPSSSSPLTAYLAAGPSVWEFQDEATGTIARAAYAAGAFDWPVDKWYRSMGVYPSGTDTSGHMTVGSPY